MLLHVYRDVFKALILRSCVVDLQSIRDHESTTSKQLIMTDVLITSRKTWVEVANSGKTMTFYESIQTFPKNILKLPISIIRTTNYLKRFLLSLALWIIKVSVYGILLCWVFLKYNPNFMWRLCYLPNIKAQGHVVSDKKIFKVFISKIHF